MSTLLGLRSPYQQARPVEERGRLGSIFNLQNAKTAISTAGIITGVKAIAERSINLSSHAGSFAYMIPEKIFQIPTSAFVGDTISPRSKEIYESLRVHALAFMRLGVCVTGAQSLLSLIQSREEVNLALYAMSIAYYSGITIDYAYRSVDSLRELHQANDPRYVQANLSLIDYMGILKNPDGSINERNVETLLAFVGAFEEEMLRDLSSEDMVSYYSKHLPGVLEMIENHIPKEQAVKFIGSKLSFLSYVVAMSRNPEYWASTVPHLFDANINKEKLSLISSQVDQYRGVSDIEGERFLEIKKTLRELAAEYKKRISFDGGQHCFNFYASYRNLDYQVASHTESLAILRQEIIDRAFLNLFRGNLEDMDQEARELKEDPYRSRLKTVANLLEKLHKEIPQVLKPSDQVSDFLSFPGQRMEVVLSGGQVQYQYAAVKEYLVSRFDFPEDKDLWACPFEDDPQQFVSALLLGRSNESAVDFVHSLTGTHNGLVVNRYKKEVEASVQSLLDTQEVRNTKELELYVKAQWARFEAFKEVLTPILPESKTVESLILTEKQWNMLSVLNSVFKDAPNPSDGDDDYKSKLIAYLEKVKEEKQLDEYASWLGFINQDKQITEGSFDSRSNLPQELYKRSIPSIKQTSVGVQEISIGILKKARSLFIPALETVGALAITHSEEIGEADIRRSFMAGALGGFIGGVLVPNATSNIGRRWQFTNIQSLRDAEITDLRTIARQTWLYAQSAISPNFLNIATGAFTSSVCMGRDIGLILARGLAR